jgi:hypothetical protein
MILKLPPALDRALNIRSATVGQTKHALIERAVADLLLADNYPPPIERRDNASR